MKILGTFLNGYASPILGDNAKRENREETVRNRCGLPTLFLKLNGFHALRDENSANTQYVRVVGRIVSSIKGKDIRTFLRQFARNVIWIGIFVI